MRRRFPSERQTRAVEIGVDELMNSLEWFLRLRPRALRATRARYRKFCTDLLAQLERASRELCEGAGGGKAA
jgi:hypothetical protein